ncbi:hypothetical protein SAMN02910400_02725 [Lachnospiraceae bacterium C10]|nr:hypothetical protein SAMN02910400_02725 [Lachnospiraceae bacterium C10]
MRETRKTVLFIVEGASDKSALEKIFKRIYRKDRTIEFRFTDGDISSNPDITVKNVEDRIHQTIKEFLVDRKLKKSDIYLVVQLFDMDGAYIPDSAITLGDTYKFVYSTSGISCNDPHRAIERNKRKRDVMDHLLNCHNIKDYPYEMYFMSCNLDHALYDQINLDKDDKQDYADAFYEKFIDRENMFIHFLETDVVHGVPDSLPASWQYIKKDLHSVERHTNLHIYFKIHPNPGGFL